MQNTAFQFEIVKKNPRSKARRGVLRTSHGSIETPAFVAVGTNASVKALSPEDIVGTGSQIVLANAYHLLLEGRSETVESAGGLHKFMNWHGPMMTDSGGFQVFSLGFGRDHKVGRNTTLFPGEASQQEMRGQEIRAPSNLKIFEEGVIFNLLSGERMSLTPEKSINIQERLGADIMFAFDECTSPLSDFEYNKQAMDRTHRWAERSIKAHTKKDQALFGIIQGGEWRDLREKSVCAICAMPFDGFGMGGYFGKTKEKMYELLNVVTGLLPEEKPRHHLGIGRPEDIPRLIESGLDLFDCAAPTREARNGTLYRAGGNALIQNSEFRNRFEPVSRDCGCYACANFTLAYLHHLFRAKELLYYRLASMHNLYFVNALVRKNREAI